MSLIPWSAAANYALGTLAAADMHEASRDDDTETFDDYRSRTLAELEERGL